MIQCPDFTIRSVPLGAYQTNCYTIQGGDHLWIIDAGYQPEPLLKLIRESGLSPEAIILTHAHSDHIAGIPDILREYPNTPIWIHENEQRWLHDPQLNLSAFLGQPISVPGPDRLIAEGETLSLGDSTWNVLHTPGHSPGSLTFVSNQYPVALVGDALFAGSIGRTDFPNSSFETLADSIRTKLYTLPDDVAVLPGHGPTTTIGKERATNPFVQP
ncbi:MAG TPA: MBL fold metallo-hydrolase [Phycisphaerales bacterium]|nr:MBL fold metallo-hydrolase [Phycisphaerales bacterium]